MDLELKEQEIRQEIGSLSDEAEGIMNLAKAESRDLSEEETQKVDSIIAKSEQKTAELERTVKLKDLAGIKSAPKVAPVQKSNKKSKEELEYDWKLRTVRYFKALAMKKEDSERSNSMLNELRKEVRSLGEEYVTNEIETSKDIIYNSSLSTERKSVLSTVVGANTRTIFSDGTGATGGSNLLPKPFLAELFVTIERYSKARNYFRVVPMVSSTLDLKNVATKVVSYWTGEGTKIKSSDPAFSNSQLVAKKLAGITSWTTEMQDDEAIGLLPIVIDLFAESIAKEEDTQAFMGNGTTFTGLGYLSNANVIQPTIGAGANSPDKLTEAFLRSAVNGISEASREGAVWFMHSSILDAIAQFENTAGFRILQTTIEDGAPSRLLGYPVVTNEVMTKFSSTTAEVPYVIFGDPKRALMGVRQGLNVDISTDAILQSNDDATISYNAFQQDGALLRVTERVGFKVPAAYESSFSVIKTNKISAG